MLQALKDYTAHSLLLFSISQGEQADSQLPFVYDTWCYSQIMGGGYHA